MYGLMILQGFSYLSEVGGQGAVEFGEKSVWTIKLGKIDAV